MPTPILKTKLFVPPLRSDRVRRHRLIQQLDKLQSGLRLTLVSAPAGFGKTTLVSDWLRGGGARSSAWLSLDKNDNDPGRFLTYFVAALQQIAPDLGKGIQATLQSPTLPALETLLTTLINEITSLNRPLLVVLDDYHLIEAQAVHDILTFLLDHQPPQLHLVITTRSDPPLPLSRLRGRGQLNELRMIDLRFTTAEAAAFLQQAMGLKLSPEEVAALEARTEGWIVGLQMAALSIQEKRPEEISDFISAFAGSHRYVLVHD